MIRVLLVDDHPVVRRGLSDLLSAVEDVTVVAAVEDGADAAAAVLEHRPDVVLMDLSMPGMSGVEATRKETGPILRSTWCIMPFAPGPPPPALPTAP